MDISSIANRESPERSKTRVQTPYRSESRCLMTGGKPTIVVSQPAPRPDLKPCKICSESASVISANEDSHLSEHDVELSRGVLPFADGIAEPNETLFASSATRILK